MSVRTRLVASALFAVVSAASAVAANTLLPAPSTWTLNVAKSDFAGIPGMKSDVWHIVANTEKRLKYTDLMVLDSGEKVPNSWEGPQDGTLQPVPGMPGAKASFKLADDSGHMEMPDGSRMDMVMTLSPDKKTLTLKNDVTDKDGKVAHQTLVYDRTR